MRGIIKLAPLLIILACSTPKEQTIQTPIPAKDSQIVKVDSIKPPAPRKKDSVITVVGDTITKEKPKSKEKSSSKIKLIQYDYIGRSEIYVRQNYATKWDKEKEYDLNQYGYDMLVYNHYSSRGEHTGMSKLYFNPQTNICHVIEYYCSVANQSREDIRTTIQILVGENSKLEKSSASELVYVSDGRYKVASIQNDILKVVETFSSEEYARFLTLKQ